MPNADTPPPPTRRRLLWVVPILLALLLLALALLPFVRADERPNLILFISDDISWNDLGAYGHPSAHTPHLDRLAENGRRFTEAYLTASSCSPSRSSIVTGRYPHNTGRASELHQPIAAHLPWFPRLLREAGYYTALVGKNHMKSEEPAPGEEPQPPAFALDTPGLTKTNRGGHAKWVETLRQRPADQPFFFWFAAIDAHRAWDGDEHWDAERYGPKHRPEDMVVPPYLVDDEATRQDLASYHNEVTRFDHFIGEVLAELERQQVLDNTLILAVTDNGRPFPRAKTRLHDSGMKTFLIAHWPDRIAQPGTPSDSLASAIDLAPTFLDAAGVEPADTMQGLSLLPILEDPEAEVRRHAFSEHNWHDYEAHARSVRSDGFLYIRNHRPELAWQGPADSVRSPSHRSLIAAREAGELTAAQADVFRAPRPEEELYHTANDPLQLDNLADDEAYAAEKQRLAALLERWSEETGDTAPERITRDNFDRETGKGLGHPESEYRGTPPGTTRNATHLHTPGPR